MTEKLIAAYIQTPVDEYELIDFGNGRKLERFGAYVIDRPSPQATDAPGLSAWEADWVYTGDRVSAGKWQSRVDALPDAWQVNIDGQTMYVKLADGGQVGIYPEHIACWRWVRERLAGCYHIEDLSALNLFAASGGATLAAVNAGATVSHVDASRAAIDLAHANIGDKGARWIRENVATFVNRAVKRRETYDLIIMDPPAFGRGPKGGLWDCKRDLDKLMRELPHLISPDCRGVWVSLHSTEWTPQAVQRMVYDAMPKRAMQQLALGITTADGRTLEQGFAICWYDDREFLSANEKPAALTAAEIEERLDPFLDSALSSRRTAAEPARKLAGFERTQQEYVLHWAEVIARSNNSEMAYQFVFYAPQALLAMEEHTIEAWLMHAMDAYDRSGQYEGIAILKEAQAFAAQASERRMGTVFEEIAGVLELFVHGLNGRKLAIECADEVYTDTDTLFLPSMVVRFQTGEQNFSLYKAMVCHLWAQCWFGTWRVPVIDIVAGFDAPDKALRVFHALETIRLDACLERELPGMHRAMCALRKQLGEILVPREWEPVIQGLFSPTASAYDSCELIASVINMQLPERISYQGQIFPHKVQAAMEQRHAREKQAMRMAVARMASDMQLSDEETEQTSETETQPRFGVKQIIDTSLPDGFRFELEFDGRSLEVPDDVRGLMTSIIQDLGDVPDDFLVAAGDGSYRRSVGEEDVEDESKDVWKGRYHTKGAHLYPEWDFKRKHYRKNWCALRELDVSPRIDDFVPATLRKYSGVVKNLRRTFEALRGEDKTLKKQANGDDVDIDALVEAIADASVGAEMTDNLFLKKHKVERNIAVMFMVDMSGSTKGWINDAEREALVLLCEALECLGDTYAIYGFSGTTRNRCELYRIKRFDEPYNDDVRHRISGITPRDYTRMGVAIRHLTKLLDAIEARTKLLITLSDGKPDDLDGYRSEYGIEDTRMALIEAKRSGIHPFCITIDSEGNDYLPHLYGAVNYTVIDEVRKMPLRVSDIYRRLTT